MEFKELSLEDLILTTVDNRGRSCPVTEKESEYLPLIATNCITERLYPEFIKVRSVDKETYDNWFRGHPLPNDILFVNKGTPGKVAMVPKKVNFCVAQDMVALRIKPEYYTKYIFAVLRSEKVKQQIENMHVGTLIPHFKKGDFKSLKLQIIDDFKMQKIIGDFYFSLLEKIELNYNIIEKLENLCSSLFERWFVKFEFPNELGLPYRSNGGGLVESELGQIPLNWRIGNINSLSTKIYAGGTPSRRVENYWEKGNIPWLKTKEIKNNIIINTDENISLEGLENSSAKWIPSHSVVIAMYGATAAQLGYTAKEMTSNQACCAIVGPYPNFIFNLLKLNQQQLKELATGSAQQNLNKDIISNFKIALSDMELILAYEEVASTLRKKMIILTEENMTLEKIRDTLLPKLLSGEIEIPDESVVEPL